MHFRRAAERVLVTQPTLSAQLQQLEKRLGASLIERGGSSVMLTPLGREVAARARAVLAQVEDLKALAASSQRGVGTIRLGVPPTLGPYLLPHVVPRLHAAHPELKLYVREGKPGDLQTRLLAGEFDLVISPLPVAYEDLEVALLFREPLRVVCAPEHPLATLPSPSRDDLAGETVLAIEPGHQLHEQVAHLCEDFSAHLSRDYEGTSLDTLRLMVGMGVGIAFLPALYIRSEIGERGEIAVLDLSLPNLYRQIGLVWRSTSAHQGFFEDLAELMRAVARELGDVTVLSHT